MNYASMETLSPELQAQIMHHCQSFRSLYSLLQASPRFFQVFRSQKDVILSHLAYKQFHPALFEDIWTLAAASQIPQPPDNNSVYQFLNAGRYETDGHVLAQCLQDLNRRQLRMPVPMIVALRRLATSLQWFIQDYKHHSISFLATFITQSNHLKDAGVLYSDLSEVELGRIQRAFCRFETFRYLFSGPDDRGKAIRCSFLAYRYLDLFPPDEVEEIACVRDYMIRRLWGVFETIEVDALKEPSDGPIRQLGQHFGRFGWFSGAEKSNHLDYMEYMMSLGLPFLQGVLESDDVQRAALVISNSGHRRYYLTEALRGKGTYDPFDYEPPDFDDGSYDEDEGEFVGDELNALAKGLLWANRNKVPKDYARPALKGLRDWGYVFWDEWRLEASGVPEKEYACSVPVWIHFADFWQSQNCRSILFQ
ncbi:MAG: hypothetical protein Q9212_003185 [Teloschistes hypoglaucus]